MEHLLDVICIPRGTRFPLSDDWKNAVDRLITIYQTCSAADREIVRARLARDEFHSGLILGTARSESELAVRGSSVECIRRGVWALIIVAQIEEPRLIKTYLYLLYHSARKIGEDPVQLFKELAALSPDPNMSTLLLAIPSFKNVGPAIIGYGEEIGPDGFRYFKERLV